MMSSSQSRNDGDASIMVDRFWYIRDTRPLIFFMTSDVMERYGVGTHIIYFVLQFISSFFQVYILLVFGSLVTNTKCSTGSPPPTDGDLLWGQNCWNTNDMNSTFIFASTATAIVALFLLNFPGITGHVLLELEQFILELVCQQMKGVKWSLAEMHKNPYTVYFIKFGFTLVGIFLGSLSGAWLAKYSMPGPQWEQFYDYTIHQANVNATRTCVMVTVGFFLFSFVFDRNYRISPIGHRPLFQFSPYGEGSLAFVAVSAAYFVSIFTLYSITGDTLNFMTLLSQAIVRGRYTDAVSEVGYFIGGEAAGLAISVLINLVVMGGVYRIFGTGNSKIASASK